MNKKFYRNLRVGYGVSLVILLVVGVISYHTVNSLLDSDKAVSHSDLVILKLEQALSLMKDAETGQRGYLLTGKQEFLEPYEGAVQKARQLVDETYALTADNPAQQRNVAEIRDVMQHRMSILQAVITKKRSGFVVGTDDLDAGKAAMDTFRKAVGRAEQHERQLLAERAQRLGRYRDLTPAFIIAAIVLSVLMSVVSYIRAMGDIGRQEKLYRQLDDEKEETVALNEELTAANEEIKAANEELISINEELILARGELEAANALLEQRVDERTKQLKDSEEETQALNEELTAINEELAAANEELITANEELKATNEQLAEANHELLIADERSAKLAAIVESSDDAIIGKTLDGMVSSWNRGAERIFGYSEQEMVGASILKLIPEDLQHEEPAILARLRNGERLDHYETIRRVSDGRLINVSLTISPIRNKAGMIIGVSKIARDITEQKRDEQRKNDFIGMASHELKTPLTSLSALLQVLQLRLRNNEDTFVAGAIDKANQQTRRMAGLINGFLTISRLEAGKLHIEPRETDINSLIREGIEEQRLMAPGHTFVFEPEGVITIFADSDKFLSVISNLLSNAVKYSPRGKQVTVRTKLMADHVQVSVQDEGMGIKAQDLPSLFTRYYRVQSEHTKHISGFGVGLYLSAEIVGRHGGRIWAESEKGVGSTFYFTLPLPS